jgi:release factor glutamine methyltransferase
MKIQETLEHVKIDRLDAEVLLAHVLGKDRSWLISHSSDELNSNQKKKFDELITRRKNHEPVAYITGEKEFYGRKFKVDPRVLIPRPATEALIDEVKKLYEMKFEIETPRTMEADTDIVIFAEVFSIQHSAFSIQELSIIDVGTGSGCIGITLALEIPDIKIICTDISEDALEVAKENADIHKVTDRITFANADLFSGSGSGWGSDLNPFLVVSNPPYVPESETLPPDLSFEPKTALFAGTDGLEVVERLYKQCKEHPKCLGCMLEIRLEQAKKITTHH